MIHERKFQPTINLVNLCAYILKKWKMVVVAAVVAAIAVGGLTFMKSMQSSKVSDSGTIETVEPAIPESEKEIARAKLQTISGYEQIIEEYEYYHTNSIKVKLDSNKVSQGKLIYMFSSENVADTLKAVALWEEVLLSETKMQMLSDLLSEPVEEAMLREVIEVKQTTAFTDETIAVLTEQKNVRLEVVVSHYNRDDCETMLTFLEKQLEEYQSQILSAGLAVNVEQVSVGVGVVADRMLTQHTADILEGKTSAYEAIAKIKKEMTAEQSAYYQYLMAMENREESPQIPVGEKLSVDIKYTMVGAVAGGFLAAILYAVWYLFAGRVRGKEELKSWMNIPVMETASGVDMLAAEIAGIATKQNLKRIFLTGSQEKQNTEVLLQMKEILQKNGLECFVGNSILKDAKALQEAAACEGMVLLEKCDVSKEKDVREEILKATSFGVQVLSVILEK